MTEANGAMPPEDAAEPAAPPTAASSPAPEAAQSEETEEDRRTARQKVVDALLDTRELGAQSVGQLLVLTQLERPLLETTLSRGVAAGVFERASVGHYRLAPPRPKPPPPPEPRILDGRSVSEWMELMERWQADPSSWNVERDGPAPTAEHTRVPFEIRTIFANILEKRIEERDAQKAPAEKAAVAQVIGDVQLLEKLLAAANGNFVPGARIRDLMPVRVMLANGADLEDLLATLESRVDRRAAPDARPLTSWADHWFLCAVAGTWLQRMYVLRVVDDWLTKIEPGKAEEKRKPAQPPAPGGAPAVSPSQPATPCEADVERMQEAVG